MQVTSGCVWSIPNVWYGLDFVFVAALTLKHTELWEKFSTWEQVEEGDASYLGNWSQWAASLPYLHLHPASPGGSSSSQTRLASLAGPAVALLPDPHDTLWERITGEPLPSWRCGELQWYLCSYILFWSINVKNVGIFNESYVSQKSPFSPKKSVSSSNMCHIPCSSIITYPKSHVIYQKYFDVFAQSF